MSINFSLRKFPASGEIKGQCGLPFGCVVQPFAQFPTLPLERPLNTNLGDVARCTECYAYINKLCHFERSGWLCSLCGNFNDYHSYLHNRYMRQATRSTLDEIKSSLVEVKCSAKSMLQEADEGLDREEKMAAIPEDVELVSRPVYLALVDLSCSDEFLELVKSALLAALEALSPLSLFGIITFSDKVGLYDIHGKLPVVKYVPLLDAGKGQSPTSLELGDAMALEDLLAPVGHFKDAIAGALEGLEPSASAFAASSAAPRRGFGGAVQAVLRYLSGLAAAERVGTILQPDEAAQVAGAASRELGEGAEANSTSPPPMMVGYSGARVMCFLAGTPNFGPGKVSKARVTTVANVVAAEGGRSDGDPASSTGEFSVPVNVAVSDSPVRTRTAASVTRGSLGQQVALDFGSLRLQDGNGAAPLDPSSVLVDPRGSAFYEEAAAAAAALSVAMDLYAISREVMGLEVLEPLASNSGGQLCWYPDVEDSALPQDVYCRLAAPQARSCRLRLRTSPEFVVQRCYGHLIPDQTYENLQHIVSCGPHDCVAFDFEFATAAGFTEALDCPPTLQLAFQYTSFVGSQADGGQKTLGEAAAAVPKWYLMERRMRIHTLQVAVAMGPLDLYSYADSETILALLMHKIVRASQEEGLAEARSLLQDWLVILIAQYNLNVHGQRPPSEADVGFDQCPALQQISRLVYVLLQSPLLAGGSGGPTDHHPDKRCFLQSLWAKLPPSDLQKAIYPVLSSWTTPDKPAYPKHSLSRTALITSGEPIYLLDTFTHLIVYYIQGYPQELPFPPPQSSKLRQAINQLRTNRVVTPQIKMVRGGIDDVSLFTSNLLEEADSNAVQAGGEHLGTFSQFLELVKGEVKAFLEAQ